MDKRKLKIERKLERVQTKVLKDNIQKIVDLCKLDDQRMSFRIRSAESSEYGRVSGLTNLLAAIVCWPAEQGDGASVMQNQRVIESELKIDIYLMEDIKQAKGYHTWMNDELEVIDGKAPNTERYQMLVEILIEEIGINAEIQKELNAEEIKSIDEFDIDTLAVDHRINDADWKTRELRAVNNITTEKESLQKAADEYEKEQAS